MDRFIKFIILIVIILVSLGVGIVAFTILSPLLASAFVLWLIVSVVVALVMIIMKIALGLWLLTADEEKKLTKSDKNFSIEQGKDVR